MLYLESKRIITAYQNKEGSIDSLIAKSQFKHKPLLKCLITRTLQHKKLLEKLIKESKLLEREQFLGDTLAQLLVYDLLFGIGVRGKFKGLAKRNFDLLNEALEKLMKRYGVTNKDALNKFFDSNNDLNTIKKPKYIYINRLSIEKKEILNRIKQEFTRIKNFENLNEAIQNLGENEYLKDDLIKNLLIFSHNSKLNIQHDLFKEGHLLQIDKSSIMAPCALNPPENSFVIDACSAPGNKTLILSNLMKNTGLIYAFDIDEDRVTQMRANLKSHHSKCVRLKCEDFLSTDPNDFERVEYILLDPSCSGSGMTNRYKYGDNENENEKDEKRLWKLEGLQRKMLLHAMSFPSVKRIVYSTCSIHEEENENVVVYALKHCKNKFKLENIYPEWTNRGNIKSEETKIEYNIDYCVRANIKDNLTNGFFISCFVLNDDDDKNDKNDEENNENDTNINENNNNIDDTNANNHEIKSRKRKYSSIIDENE